MKKHKLNTFDDRKLFNVIGILILIFLFLPIFFIIASSLTKNSDYLELLIEEQFIRTYLFNTIELILKVGIISAFIGFTMAYIVTFYEFKYRNILKLLLLLPLAIPVYVGAYTYTGIFNSWPFLEVILKNNFTMNGSVFIFSIFLYPYVYLASRSYLNKNISEYIDVARTLGKSELSIFFKIILPVARPVIFASTALVIFETLSDFAVVNYYGAQTLSYILNISWLSLGQKDTASKLAILLLFVIFVLIYSEKLFRGKKEYANDSILFCPYKRRRTTGKQSLMIYSFIFIVLLLGLFLPVVQLLKYVSMNLDYIPKLNIIKITLNTLFTIFVTASIIIIVGIILSSIIRNYKHKKRTILSSLASIGYSVPSIVLALGVYMFFINVDKAIFFPILKLFGVNKYLLTSTRIALIFGLFFKFFSIAYSYFDQTLIKTGDNIFESAKTLGNNNLFTMIKINLPILRRGVKYVFIILFIDLIKELTLTYSLRPFNYKSLSTEVYRYAGNEMIEVAAYPSLVIILLCGLVITYVEIGGKNDKIK